MDQSSLIVLIVIASIVFGVVFLLTRQLNRLIPIGCFIPLLFATGSALVFLLGLSLYVDSLEPTSGRVVGRAEKLVSGSSDKWRRSMVVLVQYGVGDGVEPTVTEYNVNGQTFDQMAEGGPAAVRVLAVGDTVILSRLARMDTRSLLDQTWTAIRLWLPLTEN